MSLRMIILLFSREFGFCCGGILFLVMLGQCKLHGVSRFSYLAIGIV
jgi:hypothetical protein